MSSILGGLWNAVVGVASFPLVVVSSMFGKRMTDNCENGDGPDQNGMYPGNGILSSEEVTAIKTSWKIMSKTAAIKKKTGVELFYLLFTMHESSKKFFRDFRDVPNEQLREHKLLKAHAASVMYSLQSYIDNLDDLETLVGLVNKTAESHNPRGVHAAQFALLKSVICALLEEVAKDECKDLQKAKDSWSKLLDKVVELVKAKQDQLNTK